MREFTLTYEDFAEAQRLHLRKANAMILAIGSLMLTSFILNALFVPEAGFPLPPVR